MSASRAGLLIAKPNGRSLMTYLVYGYETFLAPVIEYAVATCGRREL